jgi:hypothetical protein
MKKRRPGKYRTCPECGLYGLIAEEFYTWVDKGIVRVSRLCRTCTRAHARARYAERMSDPYIKRRERERQRTWAAEKAKRDANPDRCRRYRARLKVERPSVYQQQLEDARIRRRLRNDLQGKPVRTKRALVTEPKAHRIPVAPLARVLREAERAGVIDPFDRDDGDSRAFFRVLHETDVVSVRVADRLLTRVGSALAIVYPELYA